MVSTTRVVAGGVDTHLDVHVAAVVVTADVLIFSRVLISCAPAGEGLGGIH